MARMKGHKRGCRCVGCNPAARAKGMRKLRALQKAGKLKRRAPRTTRAQAARSDFKALELNRQSRGRRRTRHNPSVQWEVTWYTALPEGRGTDRVFADNMDQAVHEVRKRHPRSTIVSASTAGAGAGVREISCAVCGRPFAGHDGARLCPHCFRDETAARLGGAPGDIRDRY